MNKLPKQHILYKRKKYIILFFILIFILLIPIFSFAKDKEEIKKGAEELQNKPSTSFYSDIKIGDYFIFKVGSTDSLTHTERAEIINNRINTILKSKKPIPKTTIEPYGNKNLINIGEQVILTVTNQDTHDNLKSLRELSEEWAGKIDTGMQLFKESTKEPVIVDGAVIFTVGPTDSLIASERAIIVNRRLRSFVENPEKIKPATLSNIYGEWTISIDDVVLITVVDIDAKLNSIKIEDLAKNWSQLIDKTLERAKKERTPQYILFIIIKIILCIFLVFVAYKIFKIIKTIMIKPFITAKPTYKFQKYIKLFIKFIYWVIILSINIYALIYIMELTPYTRPYLNDFLQDIPKIFTHLVNISYNNVIIIAIIILLTIPALRLSNLIISKIFNFIQQQVETENTDRFIQRSNTFKIIIKSLSHVIIIFIGFILITLQLNINILPILASAGILGLAISFGAQNLVKDLINGFFIVFEDQYGIGDVITVDNITGTVEKINLRITQLRGMDGSLTTIPNSNVNVIINLSKEWSRAILDIAINLNENPDKVMEIIMQTAKKLKEDWMDKIIEEPVMLGIDKIENSQMVIRIMLKTIPSKQWDVVRELRKRVKLAFDYEKISLPFPQYIVWVNRPISYIPDDK